MSFLSLRKDNQPINDEEKKLNKHILNCIKKAVKINLTISEVDALDKMYKEYHDKNGWSPKNHLAYNKIQRLKAFCK